jgi:hypothetical protein
MGLSREEVEKIGQETAQRVLEALHRYTITYEEPRSIEQGIRESMVEESTAANWYRRRAISARRKDEVLTADLYEHIAKEEDQHYQEFQQRLNALKHEITPLTPEVEISEIVADLNLLREEKVWIDTFKTKGASIVHLQTGDTATIIDTPQDYTSDKYEDRAMHIQWADGSEMVVDSNDFAPSKLQKEIAEITHGKPIPEFPTVEGVTPEVTEREARYGFLQLNEVEYNEAVESGRYPEPERYEKLTEYYTEKHEPGWKGVSLAEMFPTKYKDLLSRGVPDKLSPLEVKTVIEEKRIPYDRGVELGKVTPGVN